MISTLAWALVRALVSCGLALAALPLLARAPAALRRACLTLALGLALLAPLVSSLSPAVVVPASVAAVAKAPFVEPLEAPAPAAPRASGAEAPPRAVLRVASPEAVLAAVWALVAGVLVARLVVARVRASRLGGSGVDLEPGVVVTSDVEGPLVVGALRPRILLPPVSLEWNEERLGVVLAHERAHVASRDGLARLLGDVTCALYWPVPTVWLAARRLSRECELAADERVVRGGVPAVTVAEHLVAVAQEVVAPAPLGTFGMASELGRRVHVLLTARLSTWSRGGQAAAFLAAFGALAVVACAAPKVGPAPAVATLSAPPEGPLAGPVVRIADEERARAIAELGAAGGVVLVMDAKSHTLLAASGDVDTPRVPGSTVKPLVVAAALDAKVLDPKAAIDCGNGFRMYGARKLEDASSHGALSLAGMLAVSSNVGASRVADSLGRDRTIASFRAVGLGDGVPARVDDGFELGVLAAGEGLRASPRALVRAYGTLVDGTLDGLPVFRPETAREVRGLLEEVVYGAEGTGARAAVAGVRIAGKTGTSEDGSATFASFVGFVPAGEPRFVVYVGIDSPRDRLPGGKAAAPVFARTAARLLAK